MSAPMRWVAGGFGACLIAGPGAGRAAEASAVAVDTGGASLVNWVQPDYPEAAKKDKRQGAVDVEFVVGQAGGVSDVALVSATGPDFGAALVSAVETWTFQSAMKGGARIPVRMRATLEFAPPAEGEDYRLAAAVRSGDAELGNPGGLDAPPAPLWRGFPAYPEALRKGAKPTGQAEIEFIVGRDGRARLPRIVSASAPEFGWAAATAVNQWVFTRPLRHGEPADVRVDITVKFEPPAD